MRVGLGKLLRTAGRGAGTAVRGLALLCGAVIAVDMVGGLTVGYPPMLVFLLHEAPFMGQDFDPVAWAEGGSCVGLSDGDCFDKQQTCPRGAMVRSLVREQLVVGTTTRAQVLSLLGPVEGLVKISGATCDDYGLGVCSGLGWDHDSLYVCYAGDGTVSLAGHVQH